MMQLDEALLAEPLLLERPAVLVAQGLAAIWWPRGGAFAACGSVAGAWLVAPPDLDAPERLAQLPRSFTAG